MTAISTLDPPFLMPLETVVDLPPPPSVNKLRRIDRAGLRALNTWKHQAGMAIMVDGGMRRLTKMPGRFEVTIILDEKQTKIDGDNGCKALIDYAKKLGLIIDDAPRYMRRIVIEWGEAKRGCRLILRSIA